MIEQIKDILMVIKTSNEHSKSAFWNSGPKQHTQGKYKHLIHDMNQSVQQTEACNVCNDLISHFY